MEDSKFHRSWSQVALQDSEVALYKLCQGRIEILRNILGIWKKQTEGRAGIESRSRDNCYKAPYGIF
jgi:hypothetical protein